MPLGFHAPQFEQLTFKPMGLGTFRSQRGILPLHVRRQKGQVSFRFISQKCNQPVPRPHRVGKQQGQPCAFLDIRDDPPPPSIQRLR